MSGMGVDGAHNTVGKMSAPIILFGKVTRYYRAGVQGTVLGIAVDLSVLPYFLRPFPGPYRAGIPGRFVPVGFDCARRRGAVSRGSAHSRSEKRVGVKSGVLARPSGRRGRPEAGWRPKRALRSERWAGVKNGRRSFSAKPSGQCLDRSSGLSFRYLGRPKSCALFAMLPTGPSLCWEAGPRGTPGL